MTTSTGLTEPTRKALKEAVDSIRKRLVEDLYKEADRRFSLALKDRSRLTLSAEDAHAYGLLQSWCQDELRADKGFVANLKSLIKECAYSLTNRLVILRQLEARGLQALPVLTGGQESAGYKEFRDFCPGLCQGEDGGYQFLLQQLFDKLALDLPGFFSPHDLESVVRIPGPTLFWLVEVLNRPELTGAWTDDTTLGWLYQYWNDPDRTAVNDKVAGKGVKKGKIEASEIAHATQLFTERYMVEWLLQNSLGSQWLAICQKRGWQTPDQQVIDTLEQRRADWRQKIADKAVPEDQPMPIETPAEARWKFYIPQALPSEVVQAAPESLKEVKVLDPACGSGHFLVYAFDLLFDFYQAESQFLGQDRSPEQIVQMILQYNLHGIDIDPRAVQLAAAALWIKAKEKAPAFEAPPLNLVATNLGLGNLSLDDPSVTAFVDQLANEGIQKSQSHALIESLKGADYLGSLLQVDTSMTQIKTELPLFQAHIDQSFEQALKTFMLTHDTGDDLGVKTRAEQLAKGLRLMALLGQKYEVVCANPPYLGLTKTAEKIKNRYEGVYPNAKSDLYTLFLLRNEALVKPCGFTATVAMHGWMFLSTFESLREELLNKITILKLAHLGSGAFQAISGEVTQVSMQINVNLNPLDSQGIYQRCVQENNKENLLLCPPAHRLFTFQQSKFQDIPGAPMIYWWPEEFREVYLKSPKLGEVGEVKHGIQTHANKRFVRYHFEIDVNNQEYNWYAKGSDNTEWFYPIKHKILWGIERHVEKFVIASGWGMSYAIYNKEYFDKIGVSYSIIGHYPVSGLRQKSIFDMTASTMFIEIDPFFIIANCNSMVGRFVTMSLNPTINLQKSDLEKLVVLCIGSLKIKDLVSQLINLKKQYPQYLEIYFEYQYINLDPEIFEKQILMCFSDLNDEFYQLFKTKTVAAIKSEVGESPGNYPRLSEAELAQAAERFPNFADIYLNGPYKYEYGEIKRKSDGTPERGKLQSLEELCHEFELHPESVIALRKHLGIQRETDRQEAAYRHLGWALGVALGRFDAQTGGLVELAEERRNGEAEDPNAPSALPHGSFFVSERAQLENPAADEPAQNQGLEQHLLSSLTYKHGQASAQQIWQEIEDALVRECKTDLSSKERKKRSLNWFLRHKAFEFHKKTYENRPIYFPLCSSKKSYVVWCNIHQWNPATLETVLAEYLMPEKRALSLKLEDLRRAKVSTTDQKEVNAIEKSLVQYDKWHDELEEMIQWVAQIAKRGFNPEAQEREAPFVMDLDDGVMVNSAALWPLLQPLWKDPKKWAGHLIKPVGKNDYDWSHLAMRYWPQRVYQKLTKDPSLAVAHSDYGEYAGRDLFAELHPEMAKKWEAEQAKG